MLNIVPGTSNPFMRCGRALQDSSMPEMDTVSLTEFKALLLDFFSFRPETKKKPTLDNILRFESGGKIYGGNFIARFVLYLVELEIVPLEDYNSWGTTWHLTFGDIASYIDQVLSCLEKRSEAV